MTTPLSIEGTEPEDIPASRGEYLLCAVYCDHFEFDSTGVVLDALTAMKDIWAPSKGIGAIEMFGYFDKTRLTRDGIKCRQSKYVEYAEVRARGVGNRLCSHPIWGHVDGVRMEYAGAFMNPPSREGANFKWHISCAPSSENGELTNDNVVFFGVGTEWAEQVGAHVVGACIEWFIDMVDRRLPWYTGSITLCQWDDCYGELYYQDILGNAVRWDRMVNWYAWHTEDPNSRRTKMRSIEWGNFFSDPILNKLGGTDAFLQRYENKCRAKYPLVQRPARRLSRGGIYLQTGTDVVQDLRMRWMKSPGIAEEYAAIVRRECRDAGVLI